MAMINGTNPATGIVYTAMQKQQMKNPGASFNAANWTPDQGFNAPGMDNAYRSDPAFAAKVNSAYAQKFNSLNGANQFNFYNENRQIGNALGTQLGINNDWINAYAGGNGSTYDPNNPDVQRAEATAKLTPGAQFGTPARAPGTGPGGGTGLGARLTGDQSNNVGGAPIAGLTSGMYGNAALDANGNMVKGANPTIVQAGSGGPNSIGYAIRPGSQLPGAPAGTMVGSDGKTVTGPDGKTGAINPDGTVAWNSTTPGNGTTNTTPNSNAAPNNTTTTQPAGNGGGAPNTSAGNGGGTPNTQSGNGGVSQTTSPATTAQPTSGIVNSAIGGPTAASTPNVNLAQGVNPNETVAGQLQQDLTASNPIIESARARAMQLANARGLQNSSLAAEGGEQAAVNSAMEIAKQDASTYAQQSISNQDVAAKKYISDTSNATQTNIANLNNAASIQRQNLADQTQLANTGLNTQSQANLQAAGFSHQDAVNLQTLTQTGQQTFSAGLNNLYSLNLNPGDLQTAVSNYLSAWTGYPYLPPSTQTFITNAIGQIKQGQTPAAPTK